MGNPVLSYAKDRKRLQLAKGEARRELPADWLPAIDAEARQARPAWSGVVGHPIAQENVYPLLAGALHGGAAAADISDAQIKMS